MNYSNPYTAAIDNLHVSESAIEAALAAAKLRAAKTASAQAKVRYAAIAASVVLAGAASAVYFGNIARFQPPVSPAPAAPTVSSTQADSATEAKAARETTAATEEHTAPTEKAQGTESAETSADHTETYSVPKATEFPAEPTTAATEAPAAPSPSPTEPDPIETPTEQSPLPEVDSSLLCADGKLFIAIAETGMEQIDEPTAFSDDHLLYIETKFGRYYQIKPYSIEPERLTLKNSGSVSEQTCYLYNSDGEIISTVPSWW
ncbi:MAG: hypothetical protein IJG87_00940 [Ruminococcus sp.]|nr:hypothetical protein [Ruminococcus sp.]